MIEATGLAKTFTIRHGRYRRDVEAVRGIDLTVSSGEIFGLLGPNGAGKTTTVRMLATLLPLEQGEATVAGHDLRREPHQVRAAIGYVSQAGGLDETATPRDNLVLQARLCRMPPETVGPRMEELLARLGLSDLAGRVVRALSGGQKRRLALAIGLMHRPPLLFLDEPTLGLDPLGRANLWQEVQDVRDSGTTIVLTTNYLDEADVLCDRLGIIDGGRLVAEGTPEELKGQISGDPITVRVPNQDAAGERVASSLGQLAFVRSVQTYGRHLRMYVDDGEKAMPQLLRALEAHDVPAEAVSLSRVTLDDVFLERTGHTLGDAA